MKLAVVFEDNFIVVFDKPSGLVVTRSQTQSEVTLEDILIRKYGVKLNRGGIVHRLDKDTSGLIVIAKTRESLENLQAQFKSREVKKVYLALVHGQLKRSEVVEGAIIRNPKDREKFTVIGQQGGGRDAVTRFEPVQELEMMESALRKIFTGFNSVQFHRLFTTRYPYFTLVRCYPQTGRTHQIRVHLKHIGFPVVGDDKYGGRKVVRLDRRWCPRQFLHAAYLSFRHPQSNQLMELNSQLPEDLQQAWKQLTTYSSSSLPS